jgi:hypothetical protein
MLLFVVVVFAFKCRFWVDYINSPGWMWIYLWCGCWKKKLFASGIECSLMQRWSHIWIRWSGLPLPTA